MVPFQPENLIKTMINFIWNQQQAKNKPQQITKKINKSDFSKNVSALKNTTFI